MSTYLTEQPTPGEHPEYRVMIGNVQTGQLIGEVQPNNLSFSMALNGIGSISFDMSKHHALTGIDKIEPYATDWVLMRKETHIIGGIVTAVNVDWRDRFLSLAGLDYKHYFEKRIWPFDPANPTDNIYVAVDTDVFQIVMDIMDGTLGEPNSLQLMPMSMGMSGIMANYRIEPGDTETIFEKLRDLSEQDPGFHFDIHADIMDGAITRELMLDLNETRIKDFSFDQGRNVQSMSYTHEGVRATRVVGQGAGTSLKVAAVSTNESLEQKYRRLDESLDFGDIIDEEVVQRQADAAMSLISKGNRTNLQVTVIADERLDFFSEVELGDSCRVRGYTEYEAIDDFFKVIGIDVISTEQGDEEITVVFEDAQV